MKHFKIQNLDCAHCAITLEEKLRAFPGVRRVSINFASETLSIDADDVMPVIDEAIRHEPGISIHNMDDTVKEKSIMSDIVTLSAAIILSVGAFALSKLQIKMPDYSLTAFYISAWLIAGYNVLITSFKNILRGKIFDENFLMSISTICAFVVGAHAEAAGVMIFYNAGELLQERALRRSRSHINSLLELKSEQAIVLRDNAEERVHPKTINPGETIRVLAGMRVPLDGIVSRGESELDVSALTGESLPRSVSKGAEVLSGSVNTTGSIDITVTKVLSESYVSRILRLVEESSQKKARTEKFITRFARYYTPAAVGAAALTALIPWLFMGSDPKESFYRACVLLVISCPCALVISVPLGYFGGIGGAARRGILLKGSSVIDSLAKIKVAVFDKTGTLTKGQFSVTGITPANGFGTETVMNLAAAVCKGSTHPVSRAVALSQKSHTKTESHREYPGMGVEAVINGTHVLAGNEKLMKHFNVSADKSDSPAVLFIAVDKIHAGTILLSDSSKEDSARAMRDLSRSGIKTVMLSGDNKTAALAIADLLGIDEVRAELFPHQKVEEIEKIMARSGKSSVAFIGDGINDAPVLARADCGIAMGAFGSDAAVESADAVIMNDSPLKVHEAIMHARRTKTIITQNISFALGVKAVFAVLGIFGIAQMWEAVFADTGVALLAVFNAMRVLKR
jgi:Zn2+/Cd2+-exporting ATPase